LDNNFGTFLHILGDERDDKYSSNHYNLLKQNFLFSNWNKVEPNPWLRLKRSFEKIYMLIENSPDWVVGLSASEAIILRSFSKCTGMAGILSSNELGVSRLEDQVRPHQAHIN